MSCSCRGRAGHGADAGRLREGPVEPKLPGWRPQWARNPHARPGLLCRLVLAWPLSRLLYPTVTRCMFPGLWVPLRDGRWASSLQLGWQSRGAAMGGWRGSEGVVSRDGADAPSLGEGSRTELNCGAAWSPRTQTQCPTPPRDTSRLRLPVQAGVLTRPPTPAKPVKAPAHSPRGAASSTVPHAASALLSPDR